MNSSLAIRLAQVWPKMISWRQRQHRVPIKLQLSPIECGAACLAMILSFHGRATQIAECRDGHDVGRDGMTARAVADVARKHGLRVKAYSLEPEDFKHLPLPAIAHWNFNHFVVVERWSPKEVEIIDPAIGRRRLTPAQFDEGITGVVLTFEPGVQFKRRRAAAPMWHQYLGYLARTPGLLAQVLGASLVLQLFGMALPLVTKVLVDQVMPFHIAGIMPLLGVGIAILVLAQLVTSYLRAALLIYLQARTDSQVMLGFFEHLLALPYRFFEQRPSGDLLMRLGSNAVIREALTSQTLSVLLDGALVLCYLALLLAQSLSFGAIVLAIGLLQIALLLGTARRMHDLTQRDLMDAAASQSYLVEALNGIAMLKASGREDRALDHWSDRFFNHMNTSLRRSHLASGIETVMTTLRTFSPLLLLWIGALRVLDGSLSLGTMLALNALAGAFLTPLASLVSSGQRLQLAGAHLNRLADVLDAVPEQALHQVEPTPRLNGRIELQHVSFRYDPTAPLVLRDLSLVIEPGQTVALVGRTGSGKSTLARLLLGLYTPTEGQVVYDGIPLERLNYRALRGQFGVVLQESFLFSGSIRQNIAFNDPDLTLEQVVAAARLAAIHDEIMQMPMGYETLLVEGGGLSGGQRQRLALARALAHQPAILLLDEASSHLDVATERLVDESIRRLACTRIVIAHRLSTIRTADLILVLDQGAIVERGSHMELLARGGYYAALVQHQVAVEADLVSTVDSPAAAFHSGPSV